MKDKQIEIYEIAQQSIENSIYDLRFSIDKLEIRIYQLRKGRVRDASLTESEESLYRLEEEVRRYSELLDLCNNMRLKHEADLQSIG